MVRGAGKVAAGVLRTSGLPGLSIALTHLLALVSVMPHECPGCVPLCLRDPCNSGEPATASTPMQATIEPVMQQRRNNDAHCQWHLAFICCNPSLYFCQCKLSSPKKTLHIVNFARVIATVKYHFVIAVWRAKEAECGSREVLGVIVRQDVR
jgi:hypothetical protein